MEKYWRFWDEFYQVIKISASKKKKAAQVLIPWSQMWAPPISWLHLALTSPISYLSVQIWRTFQLLIVSPQAIFIFLIRSASAAALNGPNKKARAEAEQGFHLYSYATLMSCVTLQQRGARGPEAEGEPERSLFQTRSDGLCPCHMVQNICNSAGTGR